MMFLEESRKALVSLIIIGGNDYDYTKVFRREY